jgi:hypothetical protein
MKHYILFLMAVVFMAACKDEESIEITSLSKGGDTFYFGEKVPVWTMLRSNPGNVSYDWECTGGVFDGHSTQHLFENLWIAPHQAGEYTVQVTANLDDRSESRQTSMKVTNFYTDTFEDIRNPYGWVASGGVFLWNVGSLTIQNSSDTRDVGLAKELTAADDLKPPFSIQVQSNYSAYRTGVSSVSSSSGIGLRIEFAQPSGNPEKPYVNSLRWFFCPTATNNNHQLLIYQTIPENGAATLMHNSTSRSNFLAFPANELHTFTITIREDLQLLISIDGEILFDTDLLRNFVAKNEVTQDFRVSQFLFQAPRKSVAIAPNGETEWNLRRIQINDSRTAIGGDLNHIGFEELQ